MDGEAHRLPVDGAGLAPWVAYWSANRRGQTLYKDVELDLVRSLPSAPGEASPRVERAADAPAFLRRALDQAVDVALSGVRRAAVLTGGGLDSSVLLGLATKWAERTGGTVFAVSLDFESRGDDRPHLVALQQHLGCEVVRVKPEDAAARISLLATGIDAAPATSSSMPMEVEMLARARAHGAERVLGGAGGDELFGGAPASLANVARRGHPLRALRMARAMRGFTRPARPAWSWIARPLLGRWLPRSVRAWRGRRLAQVPALPWAGPVLRAYFEEKRRLAGELNQRVPRTPRERFAAMDDEAQQVVIAWGRQMEEHASGVDCWYPYVDPDLMSAVASLEPEYLLFGDRWRGLLRAAASDLLPVSLRERMDKAYFEPAMRRWIDAAGGLAQLGPLASGRELASFGLIEPAPFRAAFERFVADPEDGESWCMLWAALATEAFLRGRRG